MYFLPCIFFSHLFALLRQDALLDKNEFLNGSGPLEKGQKEHDSRVYKSAAYFWFPSSSVLCSQVNNKTCQRKAFQMKAGFIIELSWYFKQK